MKIAQVLLRFDAPGGVETTVAELSQRLRASGETVEVFAGELWDESTWTKRSQLPATVAEIPVHWFPVRRRLVRGVTLPTLEGLLPALAASRPDVIHAHSHRYGHVLQSALYAARSGSPLVISTHYHPPLLEETPWKRLLLRLQDVGLGQVAYRLADALAVETRMESDLVRRFAPGDRIRVIPPGIDLAQWTSSALLPPPELPDEYWLFVGRVATNKGLPTLLEALAQIPEGERLPLVLMGPDWGLRPALEALARRLRISQSIRFLGYEPDPSRYRAILAGASALVLPSEWEAFGLVLLEAMAAGVPIVATRVGGMPEVLAGGRAGRLAAPGSPSELAEGLLAVQADPTGTQSARAEGLRAVQAYDWSTLVHQYRSLYRSVIEG